MGNNPKRRKWKNLEGKVGEFSRCGGWVFALLAELEVDVAECKNEIEIADMIEQVILERINLELLRVLYKNREGIRQRITVVKELQDGSEVKKEYVTDNGIIRKKRENDITEFTLASPVRYNIASIRIAISNEQVYVGEVYGPLFGRGASCDIVTKDNTVVFTNPIRMWVS